MTEHLTDSRWREVFILVAGLMRGGADELLLLMEKEAQAYLNTPKLKALIMWADQATAGSAGNSKPAAKRAAAIFLARARARARAFDRARARARTRALDRALNLALARDRGLDLALARAFEKTKIFNSVNFVLLVARLKALKAQIPDGNQPIEVRRAFRNKVLQTWYNALNLNPESVDLSEAEAKALENYFYANWLMVQCKQAAVRVSPTTWQGIEDRMVTVRE